MSSSVPEHLISVVNGVSQNKSNIHCKICPSKILLANKAEIVHKPTDLPMMTVKAKLKAGEQMDTEHFMDFWLVKDMFTFENIGFSHAVGDIKYLICADCEQGPIGWCLDRDRNNLYLCHDRVIYK